MKTITIQISVLDDFESASPFRQKAMLVEALSTWQQVTGEPCGRGRTSGETIMMMTDWYPPTTQPVRDGLYLTRHVFAPGIESDYWVLLRWNCKSRKWYSSGSKGASVRDEVGSRGERQWRGLKEPA